jgi:anti-anti-sigma factor
MSAALAKIQVMTVTGLDGVEVVVGGEIDLDTCPSLEAHLAAAVEHGGHDLRLDLGEVTFLDSSGIRVLATFHERLAGLQRRLILTKSSASAARVLALSGMTQVLGVDATSVDGDT